MSYESTPLFIIGNPRSGTSLLRLTLNAHPQICIPPESHFFLWLEEKYKHWNLEGSVDEYLDDLYISTKFETWKIDRAALKCQILERHPKNYSELNELVYKSYCKEKNKIWGDKNKLWKEKLRDILKYYPKAKFINIVRDGRDVACSYMELSQRKLTSKYAPKLPNDISQIALKWKENISFINDFLNELDEAQFLTIRYEDFINNKHFIVEQICTFLDIFCPENGLDHLKVANHYHEPTEFIGWKEKINLPLQKENLEKFKIILTLEQIQHFEKIAGKELLRHNYTISKN